MLLAQAWSATSHATFTLEPCGLTSCALVEAARQRGASAMMLYGSYARGSARSDSDVDVLELHAHRHPGQRQGLISIAVYTPKHLTALAARGSLFVRHLRDEGRILLDPEGMLARILASYCLPASYAEHHYSLLNATQVLDVDHAAFVMNPAGFSRVAFYLLRSSVYLQMARGGALGFSTDDVMRYTRDDALRHAFAHKEDSTRGFVEFCQLTQLIKKYLGSVLPNPFGSLEALATFGGDQVHRLTFGLAVRLLEGADDLDYGVLFDVPGH